MPGPVPIHSTVSNTTTPVVIAIARPTRRSLLIFNDSTEDLYIKYGSGVTTTSFTLKIPQNWYARMPWGGVYQGAIWGVWADADIGGLAQVTELVG